MVLYQLEEKLFVSHADCIFFNFFPLFIENYASLEAKIFQKSGNTKCKSRILKLFLIAKFSPHETFCPERCS